MTGLSRLGGLFLLCALAACTDRVPGGGGSGGALDASVFQQPDGGEPSGQPCTSDAECTGIELRACEQAVCSPDTQRCVVVSLDNGTECKDGLLCTGPDFCIYGECGGGPLNCDDQNPCTQDSCDGKVGCVQLAVSGGGCDDDDACTELDTCKEGACKGAAVAGCCLYDGECEDTDPCTDGVCQENVCVLAYNYAPCNDKNPCTLKDHCDGEGACAGDGLLCEDGNPCTVDTCDAATGTCQAAEAADGTFCEDGNSCTSPDACQDGLCVGQGSLCQCTADLDCAAYEDENLCNGVLKCLNFVCVVDPLTVVACNPTGDSACVKNLCNPKSGQCAPQSVPDGTACDDENLCTDEDACQSGLCLGPNSACDDANPCTYDACSVEIGCTHVAHTQPCQDGDPCTANDQCAAGECKGVPVVCDDANPCTDDGCTKQGGCQVAANQAPCDDGNGCTTGDVCGGGSCLPGANGCACVTDVDCITEEDGNLCNGTLHCVANQCALDPTTVIACNTTGDTECQKTVCMPGLGACGPELAANGKSCADGNACTVADACQNGTCTGAPAVCEDANACTDDGCDPATGCWNNSNGIPCNDGNACTGNDKCKGGACGGVAFTCDDGNPCSLDKCDQALGCTASPAAAGTPCDDGTVCTVLDQCAGGICGGKPAVCNDGNPCTADTCTHPAGCAAKPLADGTPCDDGSACSNSDQCIAGKCQGNPPSCDDGDPCSIDSCDVALGCVYKNAANGTACSDGDSCTAPDACKTGVCVPGGAICGCQTLADCAAEEDGNLCNGKLYCAVDGTCKVDPATLVTCGPTGDPCLAAKCTPATGLCAKQPALDGVPCDDGDGCTVNDTCKVGACGGFPQACDDANPCTLDVCATGKCDHPSAPDGLDCSDDGNSCTGDVCKAGKCAHASVANGLPCADDGNECTYDQCTAGICQHISNDPAPVGKDECFPVAQITADTGTVTNAWTECGVADQFNYKCQGPNCSKTGAINSWPCADPSFVYDGANTGYEYAYVFVAPVDGVCTLIEYDEGVKQPGGSLFGVIDWFILSGGACEAGSCIGYVWENTKSPICGGKTCSYKSFSVSEGQVFYLVADIFDGAGQHVGYAYEKDWTVEVACDATEQLLLNEDFTDALCNGCTEKVTAGNQCTDFGWHAIGGYQGILTGYYLGQLKNNTLTGYDCGATSATLSFPSVAVPAGATSCTLSFDLYTDLDPADDGDCINDIVSVSVALNGAAAALVPGATCAADTTGSNPVGSSTDPQVQTMSYDLTYAAGSNAVVQIGWSADAAANNGLGVIIDQVVLSCTSPPLVGP